VVSEAVGTAVTAVTQSMTPSPEPVESWRTLRRLAERRRYLTILTPRRVAKEKPRRPTPAGGVPREAHHLLRPPAELTRTATNFPDPEHVRQYLRHSCDVTMSGGSAAAVVSPLGVCALAEFYLLRRVGGSSVAAIAAAGAAAAEIGRGAPDVTVTGESQPLSVAPGFGGLADAVGWLAGQDVAHQDVTSLAAGTPPLADGPEQWRLARLLQPSGRMRPLFRLLVAMQRVRTAEPGRCRRAARRRVALGVLVGLTPAARSAGALAWLGALAAWALVTVALARTHAIGAVALVPVSLMLLVTAVLAAAGLSTVAAGLAVRELLGRGAAEAGFGLVPGVTSQWTSRRRRRRRLAGRLDALLGVPAADGVPAVATWVTDRLDDLAGIPHERIESANLFDSAGLLHDGGLPGGPDAGLGRPALTFGDLWLGRTGSRQPGDLQALRRAARDPEHRVVDLVLTTTNVTQHRAYRWPLPVGDELERRGLTRFLFCRTCLEAVLPQRVVAQLVLASPAVERAHTCPRHTGAELHELPDPWDVPVALAVRMSAAVPGLLAAVPLCTVEAVDLDRPEQGSVRLHWFSDGDLSAGMPVNAFDTLLPRWPTFGFRLQADGDESAAGSPTTAWGELPAQDAARRPVHWAGATSTGAFARLVADTGRSWADASATDLPGLRGRVAQVIAASGSQAPFLRQQQILTLALRGHAAGEALRERFVGPDGEVSAQTETDRYRWIRLRTALREYRGLSLSIGARLPLYSDLAAGYRVPAALAAWFPAGFEPGSRDPSWPEAAATVTHLRALSAGGVLDWDVELGAPPVDPDLRLIPPV
jgi:hypothetical protein